MTETAQDIVARLNRTLTTMINDDLSVVGTEKRFRHIERTVAVQDAAEWIEAALAREAGLREALEAIRQYGSDTLSGPTEASDDTREWQRAGVIEMTERARAALAVKP